FDTGTADDGWWIDAIQLTGALTTPAAPLVETGAVPFNKNNTALQCPTTSDARCNQAAGGDNGIVVNVALHDDDGDGIITQGESILLDASQTTNPGGCVDGALQFKFTKDPGAVLLQ